MAHASKRPGTGVRVVVTGASGNVGTGVLRALAADPEVASVTAVARRPPRWQPEGTHWLSTDIGRERASEALTEAFRGADAVIHLAWLMQPSHAPAITWRTNVLGTERVLRAVAAAGVPAVAVASSVAAYSPRDAADPDRPVDESWPTHGWPTAAYSREKAYVERLLDIFEEAHPAVRVVRMRSAFVFQQQAAMEQRRLFAGPLLPNRLLRPGVVPFVPDVPGLRFQAVHTDDVADAFARAVHRPVRGAFNLAGEQPLDAAELAKLLEARTVRVPELPVRSLLAAAWRLRMVPASPQLFDTLLRLPLLATGRAREELDWQPHRTGPQAVAALLCGLRHGSGGPTPTLRSGSAADRLDEAATGVGGRP